MAWLIGIVAITLLFFLFWVNSFSPVLSNILLLGIIAGGIILRILSKKKKVQIRNDRAKKLLAMQNHLNDFTVSQQFQSFDDRCSLLLDEKRKKVCFIFANDNVTEIYDYKDILESEILEDGKSITTTTRSSQIGGALIGHAIAGKAGLVVGGLSGKKTTEQEVYKIDLKVIVNNTKNPNKVINFYTADTTSKGKILPVKKGSAEYNKANSLVNHWHSLLSLLIKQEDNINLENKIGSYVKSSNKLSVADEIKKLSELLDQGLITKEEFHQQKQKLLSSY